jgi:AraC-like DNA-binding protein
MTFNIEQHLYSALFLLTTIVIFEIIFNYKRNNSIKIILIGFSFGVLYYCSIHIYCAYFSINKYLLELPFPILSICYISLLSEICFEKIEKYLIVFFVFIISVYSSFLTYDVFVNKNNFYATLNSVQRPSIVFVYTKLFLLLICLLLIGNLLYKILIKYNADNIYYEDLRKWVSANSILILLLVVTAFFKVLFGYDSLVSKYLILAVLFFNILSFLFRPKFLNKSIISYVLSNSFNKETRLGLSFDVFSEAFFTKLYFLDPEASLDNFSKKIGLAPEELYRFIYKNYNSGFNDLVNENRVNYFIDVVKSKKHNNYTIDALSKMAGFSSRHHLYKPFKKFHGGVPSDLMRSLDFS